MLDKIYKAGFILIIFLIILSGFYIVSVYKNNKLIGTNGQNTIVVSGQGKVSASPDISTITFTVRDSGKSVKDVEPKISQKVAKALDQIKTLVEEKDIKTENYASYPRYTYPNNGPATIDGYEVSQTVSIKVRNVDDVSKVLSMISSADINEVAGPSYSIDEPENYKDEARKEAITDARQKAQKLAQQLGVELGRIISFSESGDSYTPQPMYMMRAESAVANSKDSSLNLPAGENDIVSNVTITFEIK
ncbi:MAG: uncharacterized protein QG614_251 [Patescibacteria group bacterium]|nr:uncharacterized protein [Patescibacteria group bacterium]